MFDSLPSSIAPLARKNYTNFLLIRLYWHLRNGLILEDEYILESAKVLKESLQDRMNIELTSIWR